MRISAKISDYNLFLRNHFQQTLVTALALVLIGITVYFFASGIGRPFMGMVLTMSNTTWVVESVDPNGTGHLSGIKARRYSARDKRPTGSAIFKQVYTSKKRQWIFDQRNPGGG